MNTTKDDRLAKQLGDFGEFLVMFILGQRKNIRVALVDHVGADIIATDRKEGGKSYAISVKSRWFKTDDPSNVFDEDNQNKLLQFASEFDMIPAVANVMIDVTGNTIDVYIITLDNLKNLCESRYKGFSIRGNGLAISNCKSNQQALAKSELVDHTRLCFTDIASGLFLKHE